MEQEAPIKFQEPQTPRDEDHSPVMRMETDDSIPMRNDGDFVNQSEISEDLDPRSELEKRKEFRDTLNREINTYLSQLDILREQLLDLEDEEYRIFAVSKSKKSVQDPAELKLDYHKALCQSSIFTKIRSKLSDFAENDKAIRSKEQEVSEQRANYEKVAAKIDQLKAVVIQKFTKRLEKAYTQLKTRTK